LQEHAAEHAGKPFFQYVAFTAPHFPLHALPEDIARYQHRYSAGWDALRAERWDRMKAMGIVSGSLAPIQRDIGPPYHFADAYEKLGAGEVKLPAAWAELSETQRAFQAGKMAIHAAMIDRMDREIGRILEQVRRMGAWDNTLILFASDNGASAEIMVRGGGHDPAAPMGSAATYLCLGPGFSGAANTPLRRHKTWVHEGGIATPLIAHWPAGIAARGELRHTPAHLIDIVPTLLEAAGGDAPTSWQGQAAPTPPGRNLRSVFERDGKLHDELWFCHEGHRALIADQWKLVAVEGGAWELYDLGADRIEAVNLAGDEPQRVAAMAARWEAMRERIAADAGASSGR
jgi:arylsulfatase